MILLTSTTRVVNWLRHHSFPIALLSFGLSVSLYVIHFLKFRFSFPLITPDEASFLSPAYDLAHKGVFSTSIHSQFLPGAAQYTYWMPPLFMLVLAGYSQIIGFSFLKAKLFAFVCFLVAGLLLSRVAKNKSTKLWTLSLWFCCPFVLMASTTIRMESVGILVTCLTIYCLRKECSAIILGVLTGSTILIHPIFLACGAAISLVVLLRKDWRQLALFGLAVLVIISPYLWYISQDISVFGEQMQLQFHRKASKPLVTIETSYLIQFVPISLLAFWLLFRLKARSELRTFLIFGLLFVDILVLKSQEFNYHLNVVPYVIASLALYVDEQPARQWFRFPLFPAVMGFFLLLLVQKGAKLRFVNDDVIYELVNVLNQNHTSWKNKSIFVTGSTDLSGFLLLQGQRVERINAVYRLPDSRWPDTYNCVVELTNARIPEDHTDNPSALFWSRWKKSSSYHSKDGQFTLSIYESPEAPSP
ncbi:glycosyltransferase family 39 protein [Spirosoma sp. KUDC1026]|uniref:glycosyltransferase family 39 protein n=1 Tax=Spirosoma sp. KUDC1026 TaxID=2745947 RepID=UPI00159BC452|nr:glycosyltransferase family 39 protein [Spirosoma sp. KUDC1026]QKZ11180.1 glycosyltransferase family 39 protein [Spirosoma sp. KUDC1026]